MKFTLEAGNYYIGCPSRVTESKRCKNVKTSIKRGNFLGSDGTQFHVLSGKICFIPYEKLYVYKEDASDFGLVHRFNKKVEITSDDGKISIVSGEYTLEVDTTVENEDDTFTFESYDDEYEYDDEDEDEDEEDDEDEDEDEEDDEDEDEEDEDEEE